MIKSGVLILAAWFMLSSCVSFKETGDKNNMPEPTTEVPAADAGGFECDASKAQYAVGQKTSAELGSKLVKETGSEKLRWIPPRSAVTMDFSPTRLNVTYDDAMVITGITCG